MLLSIFKVFHCSYRLFNCNASNQRKLISHSNVNSKINTLRYYSNESITVTFELPDGTLIKRSGKVGETVRSTVKEEDPEFPGYGSCNGGMSCGGCHVILSDEDFEKLGEPEVLEADELDKAHFLTPTSRLACALKLRPEIDGILLKIVNLEKK